MRFSFLISAILIILAFLIMAAITTGYFTDQANWLGIRQTGGHNVTEAVIITDNYPQYSIEPNYNFWTINEEQTQVWLISP